jgi:hypothetical protein
MCVGLFIQDAKRMRRTVICNLYGSTMPLHTIHNRSEATFGEIKIIEDKIRVLIFSTILSQRFLILTRIWPDTTINTHWSSCKVPVILVRF